MSHGIERAIYSHTKEFMARLLSLYCCRLHGIFTLYFLVFTLRYKYMERCHDDFFNMSKQWFINCTSAGYFQEMVIVYTNARGENSYLVHRHIASLWIFCRRDDTKIVYLDPLVLGSIFDCCRIVECIEIFLSLINYMVW